MLVGLSVQITGQIQIEIQHNKFKSPNWQKVKQLASYKRGREVELDSTVKQLQLVVRAGLDCVGEL